MSTKITMLDIAAGVALVFVGGLMVAAYISTGVDFLRKQHGVVGFAASGCVTIADAVLGECAKQVEEEWYRDGAANIDRAMRLKNNDLCRHVADAAFQSCKGRD